MRHKVNKYHAYMQGSNATVYWNTLLEAVIWRLCYNIWHAIKRDGKVITNINMTSYVFESSLHTRQKSRSKN